MIRAMSLALGSAGMASGEIGYVNAHGTGTPERPHRGPRSRPRVRGRPGPGELVGSLVGHTMAAAGSVGAIATILALEHGLVPPTANLTEIDPGALRLRARRGPSGRPRAALSNSFGFGGRT